MASFIAKKKKAYRAPIYAIFFILIGATLLGMSIKEIIDYNYKSDNYIKTESKVVKHTYKNGKVSTVILEYNVEDNIYKINSTNKNEYIKSYGSTIIIRYNPNNPEDVMFPDRGINIYVPVLAIVMISIGISIIIVAVLDNIIRLKRLSKKIITKTKKTNNEPTIGLNEAITNNYKNNYKTNNIEETNINNSNNQIEEKKAIKEPVETQVSSSNTQDIINTNNNNNSISDNNNDYINFISEINETDNEIPTFIPNYDNNKYNNK